MSRDRATVFLIGLGSAWNAGNVGPVVSQIASEFGLTLGQVGLMSGSIFCVGVAAAGFAGSWISERLSVIDGLRLCCLVCLVGNLLLAATPWFEGALVARVLTGLGLGLAFLFGGVFARHAGGSKLVGLFGAGITLGMAVALGIGGLLEDLGVDWRFAFVLSALVGVSALPLLPRHSEAEAPKHEPLREVLMQAATSSRFWRLQLIAIPAFSIPIVIGAWLVHYLVIDGGLTPSSAGLVAFVLFAVSAVSRDLGGQLLARGTPSGALSLGGLAVGAAGIAVLALEPSLAGGLVSAVLMGVGLSLPYPVVYDQGVRVIPDSPVGGLGVTQATANSFPIPITPLLGAMLAAGDGTAGWLALAAFVLIGGIVNLRPAVPTEADEAAAPTPRQHPH
jgi:YNFM family putative membrane transporter